MCFFFLLPVACAPAVSGFLCSSMRGALTLGALVFFCPNPPLAHTPAVFLVLFLLHCLFLLFLPPPSPLSFVVVLLFLFFFLGGFFSFEGGGAGGAFVAPSCLLGVSAPAAVCLLGLLLRCVCAVVGALRCVALVPQSPVFASSFRRALLPPIVR